MKPMLCKVYHGTAEDAIRDDRYAMELKLNGKRILAISDGKRVKFLNKHGELAFMYAGMQDLETEILSLGHRVVLDGEWFQQKKKLVVFDLLELEGVSLEQETWMVRRYALNPYGDFLKLRKCKMLAVNEAAITESQKRFLYEEAVRLNAEGVVLKDVNSTYRSGKRTSAWMKLKFRSTATVYVDEIGRVKEVALSSKSSKTTKYGSFVAAVWDNGEKRLIGTVNIPANTTPFPKVGDIVEVEYQYVVDHKLVNGVWAMDRTEECDKSDCTWEQLKFRGSQDGE